MAEIKSTIELVMERAATMGKATSEEIAGEEARKAGMQAAAGYLSGATADLTKVLDTQKAAAQPQVRAGMVESLLHNVFLPKDELSRPRLELALQGLITLGNNARNVKSICKDLTKITEQYGQHRTQLKAQLEEQIRLQYEQLLMQQGHDPAAIRLDPTMQPKFQEEWSKVEEKLNAQYGQVLAQHKDTLRQQLDTP
ncbi:MAG: hypothetical protein CSA34_04930 [Desulfobulbus propionicus]|nr:MAG: hypothetical protein CSA34_04930 [Desulfobulbus propionicus]